MVPSSSDNQDDKTDVRLSGLDEAIWAAKLFDWLSNCISCEPSIGKTRIFSFEPALLLLIVLVLLVPSAIDSLAGLAEGGF